MLRTLRNSVAVWALAAGLALADPPMATSARGGGVRIEGERRSSSTGLPREPVYTLTNEGSAPAVVELLSLRSLGEGSERVELPLAGARQVRLAARASQRITVAHRGRPLSLGGLGHYRFLLTVSVGGARLQAIASNAYMCRIPIRRP